MEKVTEIVEKRNEAKADIKYDKIVVTHNLMNKDQAEMRGLAYTPDAVTGESKIHGVTEIGEMASHQMERRLETDAIGYPYAGEINVCADLHGYM